VLALSLAAIANALAEREISAVELTHASLAAIEQHNPRLNGFTHTFDAEARRAASESDSRRHSGRSLGPLDGVPVAIKANIAVAGAPHHAGLGFQRNHVARTDAHVVERLKSAGAVLLGLTNMDEGALGASGQNSWYGDVVHPHNPALLPGGSSAGAAVALAANLAPLAIGSDTIGSVRIPGAFCGVAALKPTFAAVSTRGLVHTHPRFDHIGPMARSVHDLEIGLRALAGHDRAWHLSFPIQLSTPVARPWRIGFAVGLDDTPLSDRVLAGYNQTIATLRKLGHTLVHIDIGGWSLRRAYRAVFALCETHVAREHTERLRDSPQSFSPELQTLLRFGAVQMSDDLRRYEDRIAALTTHVDRAYDDVDALLTPTVPDTAVPVENAAIAESAVFTTLASATGRPAVALPIGPRTANEPPASVQLIGRPGSDYELIRLAQSLEAAIS
jgi:aspartyl-tRNA(Asn)/glutamyl-tRNA(Gln) amidotransferase subunit A